MCRYHDHASLRVVYRRQYRSRILRGDGELSNTPISIYAKVMVMMVECCGDVHNSCSVFFLAFLLFFLLEL